MRNGVESPYFIEQVTRAGFVHDLKRGKTFSFKNPQELKKSLKELPTFFELSSQGQSLLVDVTEDEKKELHAVTSPLSVFNLNGQTPRLHNDAFLLLRHIANITGKPLNWHLTTEQPEVISWAQSPYEAIAVSGWDIDKFTTETKFEAVKRFEPQAIK